MRELTVLERAEAIYYRAITERIATGGYLSLEGAQVYAEESFVAAQAFAKEAAKRNSAGELLGLPADDEVAWRFNRTNNLHGDER